MAFTCTEVVASHENVVRLQFDKTVYFSGLLDKKDASRVEHYTITTKSGTVGLDDSLVWPVNIAEIRLTDVTDTSVYPPGSEGKFIDVVLDRMMTPHPAEYSLTIGFNALYTYDEFDMFGNPVALSGVIFDFYGTHKLLSQPSPSNPIPRRDVATVNSKAALAGTSNPESLSYLGLFASDESGDYATDEGQVGLIKRLDRRTFSAPGGFLHLGLEYGLGLGDMIKKLGVPATLQLLRARAEAQYRQEPEVEKVVVEVILDTTHPNLLWLRRKIKTKKGAFFRSDLPYSY